MSCDRQIISGSRQTEAIVDVLLSTVNTNKQYFTSTLCTSYSFLTPRVGYLAAYKSASRIPDPHITHTNAEFYKSPEFGKTNAQ